MTAEGAASRPWVLCLAAALALTLAPALAAAPAAGQGSQTSLEEDRDGAVHASPDTPPGVPLDGLATGPFSTLEMLYERTIFNIDILKLLIVVDPPTAEALRELAAGRSAETDTDGDAPGPDLADEMVRAILEARDVAIQTRFRRGIGLDRFVDGMAGSLGHAVEDGLLTADEARAIVAENREHFSLLADRGFREGDVLWYRIRGDSLEMAVQDEAGETFLADARSGEARREALLGGYLARGSDFRDKLLASLFRRDR